MRDIGFYTSYKKSGSIPAEIILGVVNGTGNNNPQWVEKHFKLQQPMEVVKHNYRKNHHEDMRLMTCCHHHIIANSSFSWWGAWLNSHQDKIVIAPKKWFRDPSINTKDLVPQSWIKI